MLILVSDPFGPELPERLSRFGEVTDDAARKSEAEVLLVRSKTKVTADFIDECPKLRLVIRGGVGLDNIDIPHAESRGIRVLNTAEASTVAVAELTFALLLALPCHVPAADASMKRGEWRKKELKRTELHEKTLGVAGYGRIGEAVAIRARAFGMQVLGWRRTPSGDETAEMVKDIETLVARSDYVTLHLPATDETERIVGARLLDRFKAGAYLVNTGRGECVDERAVAAALESGKLAGFATDVWHEEPPEGSPLLSARNCVLTPHIGASTKENLTRIGVIVESLVEQHVAGGAG